MTSNISQSSINGLNRSLSPLNQSYTQIYLNRKHLRSISAQRSQRFFNYKPNKKIKKPQLNKSQTSLRIAQPLSPTYREISYKSGFNIDELLAKAMPMVDYRSLGAV